MSVPHESVSKGSVTPDRGLTGNTHFSGVNSPVWVIISQVEIKNPAASNKSADFAWERCVGLRNFSEYRVWYLLRSCGHRRGCIYGSRVTSLGVSSIFGSGSDIFFGSGCGYLRVYNTVMWRSIGVFEGWALVQYALPVLLYWLSRLPGCQYFDY